MPIVNRFGPQPSVLAGVAHLAGYNEGAAKEMIRKQARQDAMDQFNREMGFRQQQANRQDQMSLLRLGLEDQQRQDEMAFRQSMQDDQQAFQLESMKADDERRIKMLNEQEASTLRIHSAQQQQEVDKYTNQLSELDKGAGGMYANLTEDERSKAKQMVQAKLLGIKSEDWPTSAQKKWDDGITVDPVTKKRYYIEPGGRIHDLSEANAAEQKLAAQIKLAREKAVESASRAAYSAAMKVEGTTPEKAMEAARIAAFGMREQFADMDRQDGLSVPASVAPPDNSASGTRIAPPQAQPSAAPAKAPASGMTNTQSEQARKVERIMSTMEPQIRQQFAEQLNSLTNELRQAVSTNDQGKKDALYEAINQLINVNAPQDQSGLPGGTVPLIRKDFVSGAKKALGSAIDLNKRFNEGMSRRILAAIQ